MSLAVVNISFSENDTTWSPHRYKNIVNFLSLERQENEVGERNEYERRGAALPTLNLFFFLLKRITKCCGGKNKETKLIHSLIHRALIKIYTKCVTYFSGMVNLEKVITSLARAARRQALDAAYFWSVLVSCCSGSSASLKDFFADGKFPIEWWTIWRTFASLSNCHMNHNIA